MERRTILAILISIAFIVAWEKFVIRKYFPKKPTGTPAVEAQAKPEQRIKESVEQLETDPVSRLDSIAVPETLQAMGPEAGVDEAPMELKYTLKNDYIKIVFSNRGAVAQSIELKMFESEKGGAVELVNPGSLRGGMLPFGLWTDGTVDTRLYHVDQAGDTLTFTLGGIVKTFQLLDQYEMRVSVSGIEGSALSLGAGIEESERSTSRYSTEDAVVWFDGSDVERVKKKKLSETSVGGDTVKWIAIEDKYFARIFIPATGEYNYQTKRREYQSGEDHFGLSSVLVGGASTITGTAYLGPKHYDSMKDLGNGLEKIVNFGFFGIFAKWLFFGLKGMNKWVGNYGWTIVLLTVLIRLFLFPLNQASLKSTRKMQTVQPKIKAIQQKYKKYGNDMTMKQKMNQEIAELYKKEGVNPLGGCLPMLLQMPIFFAFWSLLLNAIELRHAPFMLWIQDLSAHDPYYVLPVLMGLSQLVSQIITPTGGDPNQKRMMYMLPIVFTVILAYAPSGLILYWTTNNIFQILQQVLINRKATAAAA